MEMVQTSGAATIQIPNEEQPPSYDSAVQSRNVVSIPPPSYDSLFGEIQRTRAESQGTPDFIKKVFVLIFSTVGFLVFLGLLLAIPIACIILGVTYKDECPIEFKIPIFLIVLGSFGLLRGLIALKNGSKKRSNANSAEEEDSTAKTGSEGCIDCFLFAWFICGNVWVYKNYMPDFDSYNENYCNRTLYLFAFWLNTSVYIAFVASCCCFCCAGIISEFCFNDSSD